MNSLRVVTRNINEQMEFQQAVDTLLDEGYQIVSTNTVPAYEGYYPELVAVLLHTGDSKLVDVKDLASKFQSLLGMFQICKQAPNQQEMIAALDSTLTIFKTFLQKEFGIHIP